ncbi:MAG: hypothetical protein WCD70_14940 [Alphaproteobacteria bacterium]
MIPDHIIERAAIRQFDAGYSRAEAERLAGIHPAGTILLSIQQTDDAAIEYARAWCRERELTAEDVSVRKNEFEVYVIAKQDVGF